MLPPRCATSSRELASLLAYFADTSHFGASNQSSLPRLGAANHRH